MIKGVVLVVGLWCSLVLAVTQGNKGQKYVNTFFGIEIKFPEKVGFKTYTSENLKYDVSQTWKAAGSALPDSTVQMLTSKHLRLTMLKKELRMHDSTYLDTAEFGYITYKAAREKAKLGKYSNGEYIDFKGNKAFSFEVEERLVTYGLEVNVNNGEPFLTKKGFEQWTSSEGLEKGKYNVIYFSHRGKYFELMFLKDSKVAQQIIDNLTLL